MHGGPGFGGPAKAMLGGEDSGEPHPLRLGNQVREVVLAHQAGLICDEAYAFSSQRGEAD